MHPPALLDQKIKLLFTHKTYKVGTGDGYEENIIISSSFPLTFHILKEHCPSHLKEPHALWLLVYTQSSMQNFFHSLVIVSIINYWLPLWHEHNFKENLL